MEVNGRAAILMNAETGRVLYEKNVHLPLYPGSTTKIATALFALDEKSVEEIAPVLVSADALKMKPSKRAKEDFSFPSHWLESDGTMYGLRPGEKIPLNSLLYGLILVSGNDAANVIGEALSGSVPQFMGELNLYLQNIGCKNTTFTNPHGLHHPDHKTTAYDLAILMQKGLRNGKFRELFGRQIVQIPSTNKRSSHELKHRNRLLQPGKHYYPKAIGGKTGFHSAAQYTLVAAAKSEDRTLIVVTLGCPRNDDRYEDAKGLFEAAFNETKVNRVVVPYSQVYQRSIEGAKSPLRAQLIRDLHVSYYPAEEPLLKGFVEWLSAELPIAKGAKVGVVRAVDERGEIVAEADLLALERVEPTFLHALKKWIFRN